MQLRGYFLACFTLMALSLSAQQDLGIHFMKGTWVSNLTNPAQLPEHRLVIALPGLYNQLRVDNFTYGDVVRSDNQGGTIIDVEGVIERMEEQNVLRNQADVPTLALGWQFDRFFLQAGHSVHVNAYVEYPKALAQLLWQGNGPLLGQTVDIGPDVLLQGYQSFYLGLAAELAPGVIMGGRVKLLNGLADISTSARQLQLHTADDYYQTSLEANYVLNSSGALDYGGFSAASSFALDNGSLFTGNYGLAFDLGVQMQYNQLTLAFSALDLGAINWRDQTSNLSLEGNFAYEGLDVVRTAILGETSTVTLRDSLEEAFSVQETSDTYKTLLPARFYFSGTYALSEWLDLGGLVYVERFREKTIPAFGLGFNAQLSRQFSLGGVYLYQTQEPFRFGLNTALTLGPVQLLAATDNLLAAFRPTGSHSANLRLGLNLVFGRTTEKDMDKVHTHDDFFR